MRGRRRQRKSICLLLRDAQGRHGDLYQYAETAAPSENDSGTLLASHCRDCTTCRKNGVCTLQKLSRQLGVNYVRFENNKPQIPLDESSDCVVRDPNKCILCGDCVRTCEEIQGLGILEFAYRGSKMQVMPAFKEESGGDRLRGLRTVPGGMSDRSDHD